jgi:hypothetical protein
MATLRGWLAAGVLLLPCAAGAQTIPEWAHGIQAGEPVRITMADGARIEGVAGPVSQDGLAVQTRDAVQTAGYQAIVKVQRRDGVRNGVLIGGVVGAAVASLPLVIGNECRYETCGSQLGFPLSGGALGAIIGLGIDTAIKGWTPVFDAGVQPRMSVAPVRGGFALRGAVVW